MRSFISRLTIAAMITTQLLPSGIAHAFVEEVPFATLTVIKQVINDNGGTKTAADFTMNVTGTSISSPSFPGNAGGTVVTLSTGNYSVDETASRDYTKTLSTDCSGTITNGQSKTCTITNDDIAPLLTVTKQVINDSRGTKQVINFPLFVDKTSVTSGVQQSFSAGIHTVNESNNADLYTGSFSGDCNSDGQITLALGDIKNCTITNNDVNTTGTVVVIKHVVNDNGGTKTAADFTMNVTATNPSQSSFVGNEQGVSVVVDPGDFSVDETADAGYTKTLSGDCSGSIALGETKTCTITNDDIAAPGGGGGGGGGGDSGGVHSSPPAAPPAPPAAPTPTQSTETPSTPESTPGEVLGATACSEYITTFIKFGVDNNADDVTRLQLFLNEHQNAGLEVNGVYDLATMNAVKKFQINNASEVLGPWGIKKATGLVYLTTRHAINKMKCAEATSPLPDKLIPWGRPGAPLM